MMYVYSLVSCNYSVDFSHYHNDHFNDQGNLEDTLRLFTIFKSEGPFYPALDL